MKYRKTKGQVVVEIAITFPVLLLFIMGIAQFALLLNAYSIVNYASYCACRSGVVHNANDNQIKLAASIACSPLAGNPAFSFIKTAVKKEIEVRPGTIPLRNLKVTVTHYYRLQFPLVGRLFSLFTQATEIMGSPHIPIKAVCIMRMEDN